MSSNPTPADTQGGAQAPSTTPTMLRQIAERWQERHALVFGGKHTRAAERACYEFFSGAGVALNLASHPDTEHVQTCVVVLLRVVPYPLALAAKWARGE